MNIIKKSSVILLAFAYLYTLFNIKPIQAIPVQNLKDVISSSQVSYVGAIGIGTSVNDTVIKILTSGVPSVTTNNLFIGDTLLIGTTGSLGTYTIRDIGDTRTIMLDTGVTALPVGTTIVSVRAATHTVSFEPQINSIGGVWQFLIKSTSGIAGENYKDGIPDKGGFDSGSLTAASVTCPWGATATVGTTMALTMGSPATTSYYNVVQCALGAGITNPAGTGATGTIIVGSVGTTAMLINPSKGSAVEGAADVFTYVLRHLDSTGSVLDQTVGKIAVVESVRVTATVDPTLTFVISNVGTSAVSSQACGTGSSLASGAIYTTADSVLFGSLGLGTTGNQLAQRLSCNTNAAGGYVVTAHEGGTMKNVLTGTTIPDTTCNAAGCNTTNPTTWTTASTTKSEFGYSMTNIGLGTSAATIPFTAGQFKAFSSVNPQTIMSKATLPTSTEYANVCYRITVHNAQEAGDYEAKVIYTATATF